MNLLIDVEAYSEIVLSTLSKAEDHKCRERLFDLQCKSPDSEANACVRLSGLECARLRSCHEMLTRHRAPAQPVDRTTSGD